MCASGARRASPFGRQRNVVIAISCPGSRKPGVHGASSSALKRLRNGEATILPSMMHTCTSNIPLFSSLRPDAHR
eukprot:11219928-Lingulodinium_polyedra.AAC.1